MLAKVATLLLLFFAVLAVFGKFRFGMPGIGRRRAQKITAVRCRTCGRLRPENAGCDCGRS